MDVFPVCAAPTRTTLAFVSAIRLNCGWCDKGLFSLCTEKAETAAEKSQKSSCAREAGGRMCNRILARNPTFFFLWR
jgi:hypothetical protein